MNVSNEQLNFPYLSRDINVCYVGEIYTKFIRGFKYELSSGIASFTACCNVFASGTRFSLDTMKEISKTRKKKNES